MINFVYLPISNTNRLTEFFRRLVIKHFHGKVLFKTPQYYDYFKENFKSFGVLDFIAEVTIHIPPKHKEYIRRSGVYSSRTRSIWERLEHIIRLAPSGWKEKHNQKIDSGAAFPEIEECSLEEKKKKSAWAAFLEETGLIKSSTSLKSNCNLSKVKDLWF